MKDNLKKGPIYLDYMATTPVDPEVLEYMNHFMGPESIYGNPSSTTHEYGRAALNEVENARSQIAVSVGACPEEIIFTSGATEANNLAILGAAQFYQTKGKHLITMSTEHKSVLDSFAYLEEQGFQVTYLKPQSNGLLDFEALKDALRPETILVSVMQVNNEIGVIQDCAAIGNMLKDKGIVFHVDAAQSAGKLPIDLRQLNINLMSFSAHKNYGPKGMGALYIRRSPRTRIKPISFGGGHENGMRAGTLATHQIAGMAKAFTISNRLMREEQLRIKSLRDKLWKGINSLPGIFLNGDLEHRIAGNLNVGFKDLDGDSLLLALRDLAISTTSACSSASFQPSYVLKSLGLDTHLIQSSVRISIGRFTQDEEITYAINTINSQITALRAISPI